MLLLVACLLAAGCATAAPAPPVPSATPAPARPREVRLEGVDPCSLLTAEQRESLGLTSEPQSSTPHVGLFRGDVPTCTVRGPSPQDALLVSGAVTTVGVERWTESDVAADVRPTIVNGFPALVAVPQRFTDYCNVEVDVAQGQLLDVQFGDGNPQAPSNQDELCALAKRSAELMMTTLLRT